MLLNRQKLNYWRACHVWGYCPTSDEIKNGKIEELAMRLNDHSQKETLTNLLEWQDNNVFFWDERHPISTMLFYSIFVVSPIIFSIGFCLSLIFSFIFAKWLVPSYQLAFFSAFSASIITLLLVIFFLLSQNRKIPIKEGLWNAMKPSISIQMLLRRDRKIGICRDYAKLTACLLSNIYKDSEIYFVRSLGHVATGFKVREKVYMLDQKLPLLTIDQWVRREHKTIDPSKISFLYRKAQKLSNNRLENVKIEEILSKSDNQPIKSTVDLTLEMAAILGITQEEKTNPNGLVKVYLPKWKYGAHLYEMNDEIVNYSLSHWLRRKILNELIDLTQILQFKAEKEGEDLVFSITFRATNDFTPAGQYYERRITEL
jgi:predicted transglutaminase-like protease